MASQPDLSGISTELEWHLDRIKVAPQQGVDGGMDLGLRDRVYVVTGVSRGLGRATAIALVAEGAPVVVSTAQ
jgi:hypothetical protein